MRRFLPLLAFVLLPLLAPPVADAAPTPVGGQAWNVPVIRLFDTTPRLYREGIDIAIREWNAAKVGIRFARTSNRRRAHVVVETATYPGNVAGRATLGMARGARVWLDTALVETEHQRRGSVITNVAGGAVPEEIATTMAHELGHVLGLAHTSGCSLMLGENVRDTCGDLKLPTGRWSCRMIERRDLQAASARYGGRGVIKAQTHCPLSATRAGAVRTIAALPSDRIAAVKLAWREVTNRFGYVIARSAPGGGCPASPEAGTRRFDSDLAGHTELWASPGTATSGRYCYAIWSRNGRGTLTGPTHVFIDVNAPTTVPVASFAAQAVGTTVQLSWTSPTGTTQVRIWRYAADGSCRIPSGQYHSAMAFGSATTASETDVVAGTWTYAAIRSDDLDDATDSSEGFTPWPSTPACATVTVG